MRKINKKVCCITLSVFLLTALILPSVIIHGDGKKKQEIFSESLAYAISDNTQENTGKAMYDGETVSILCEETDLGADIFFDKDSPDEYSKKAAERNDTVTRLYGISPKKKAVSDICEYLKTSDASNISHGLVYASGEGGMSSLMLHGLLDDLSLYGTELLHGAGVSVSAVRGLSVYGKIYMLTGAPVRSSIENVAAVAYNAAALNSMGYEAGYLEKAVTDGKWTFDVMRRLVKEYDGAGLSGCSDTLYYMWKGMGALTVEKENGDVPKVTVYGPKNIYYFEQVSDYVRSVGDIGRENTSLFYTDTLGNISKALSADIGILPIPSYNEDAKYRCAIDFGSTFFTAIPKNTENKQLSVEYMKALYDTSLDSVYPVIIKKYTYTDPIMLDMILKNRYFDFLDMYGIGHIVSTAFSAKIEIKDFDALLKARAEFAREALDIALRQTVGQYTEK